MKRDRDEAVASVLGECLAALPLRGTLLCALEETGAKALFEEANTLGDDSWGQPHFAARS